jgi:hypothetical protein
MGLRLSAFGLWSLDFELCTLSLAGWPWLRQRIKVQSTKLKVLSTKFKDPKPKSKDLRPKTNLLLKRQSGQPSRTGDGVKAQLSRRKL